MKQKIILIVITIIIISFSSILAQSISATLNVNPYPSPYISDWENNSAALGSLTIINNQATNFQIRVRAIVSVAGKGEIVRSITNPIQITQSAVQIINNTNLISFAEVNFIDNEYKQKMLLTGRLLEGSYNICLTIENINGQVLASNVCSNFAITYPSAPKLIFPANNDTLDDGINYPNFQWIPVIAPPSLQIIYKLRIVEVLQGQNPHQAINANVPVYENNQLNINSHTYPISAFPLQEGKKYAWQIQALDQFGLPLTQNQGKSEIFTFIKKKKSGILFLQPLVLLKTPNNNSILKTKTPKFSWDYNPELGITAKYYLRVVKVVENQTLENAINNNYPILNQVTSEKSYQSAQMLTLNPGETYAWQVSVLNAQTNATITKSEIRTFTVYPIVLLLPSNNAIVNTKRPQFQWEFYGGVKKFYDIKVIKLPMFYFNPEGIINENLFDNPQNIIYQKSNLDGSQLSTVNNPKYENPLFKPEIDIPMEDAKSYYWQITVKDKPFGNIIAKSEIRKLTFNPYQPGFATNCNVSGQLHYQFAKPEEYVIWPLKNVNIKFVIKYVLSYNSYTGSGFYGSYTSPQGEFEVPKSSLPLSYQTDHNKTVAMGKTDDNGNFSFSFWNGKSLGVVDDNFTFKTGGGEFVGIYKGKLHRVLRLIVESPYYTSPQQNIIVQPGETKNYDKIVAYVRSYSLTVTVKSPGGYWNNQFLTSNAPISKMIVYILRKNKPEEVPINEGLPAPQNQNELPFAGSFQSGYRLIAKAVTNSEGKAVFERLVKSVYSQNDEYFIYTISDSNQTSLNYRSLLPIKFAFKNQNDNAVYNFEYKYPNLSTEVVAVPFDPFVKGKIKREDGGQPLPNVQVTLLNYALLLWTKESTLSPNPQHSNQNGEFRFEKLKNIFDNQGKVTGPIRGLKLTKYGYKDTTVAVKGGNILKPGESWSTEIIMQPESKVIGKIVDEYGSGISATVTVVGGESQNAIPPFIFIPPSYKRASAYFELKAPKGLNKIIIDPVPFDNSYLKDTIDINITGNVYDMGTIVIKKAVHRIRVFVGIDQQGIIPMKLQGSKVKLETNDGVLIGQKLTNQNGIAEFLFSNPKKVYKITATAPDNSDFESKQMMIINSESKDWQVYSVYLKLATKISGYVYVGTKNQPVPNARVTIKGSSNGILPEAFTDNTGFYTLRNVPIGKHVFTASKKSSNLIGDETRLTNVPQGGLQNVNFNLKVYSDMDITNLLGFPIEVDILSEQGGEVRITGKFVDLDSLGNNLFESKQSSLPFTNVVIEPDQNLKSNIFGLTVPVAKPKILPLKTDVNNLSLVIMKNYSGFVSDNKIGIELIAGQNNIGAIKGKVSVSEASFNISSQNLKFDENGFNLTEPNTNNLNLSVITADKSSPYNTNKFSVVNSSGGKIGYKLFGFNSDVLQSNSFIYKDSLVLNTTLHTNLEGVNPSDINLNIGGVSITKNEIKPIINKTTSINLKLDNWDLIINNWSLNGVFSASSGTLKTNLVDIPLKGLQLKPKELSSLTLDFNSMSLGTVAPLKVIGKAMFGYENVGKKKWYLTVSKGNQNYAASLSGLPGLEANDSIYIASFSLYSDGTKNFSPQYKTVKIHKVGLLSLNQLIVGNNSIELGSLNFNIPKAGQINFLIQYYKENNKVKLKLLPVPIKINTNGVELAFGTNVVTEPLYFDENGLKVRGKISEEGKFSFTSWLYHTKDSTSLWVETPITPQSMSNKWQQLSIGGPQTYLDRVYGSMKVVNNSWQNFWFAGNLIVPSGIEENKNTLKFTVYGDIVASNQELGVKNIDSPFGNISFTYEPENKRFVGSLSIEKDLGHSYLKGQANAVVDYEGWYFFAGGELEVYNPYSKGAAGILIGNHSITDEMKNVFKQYSYVYKHKGVLPMTFPSTLKGFFMEGMTSIPIQSIIGLPNIDIDLVVVSAKLWINIGGDLRISMQFNENPTIGSGMDLFIEAGFGVSQWFVVECSKLSFSALLDIGAEGQFSKNGSWAVETTGDLTLTGNAKIGWGICDSECEGELCNQESWTGSVMFGIIGHIGSDGKYINFYSK